MVKNKARILLLKNEAEKLLKTQDRRKWVQDYPSLLDSCIYHLGVTEYTLVAPSIRKAEPSPPLTPDFDL